MKTAALASLQWIEDARDKSLHLAGDTVSAADIAAVDTLRFLERVGRHPDAIELDDLPRTHVGITRWFASMERLPGWEAPIRRIGDVTDGLGRTIANGRCRASALTFSSERQGVGQTTTVLHCRKNTNLIPI